MARDEMKNLGFAKADDAATAHAQSEKPENAASVRREA